MKDDLIKKRFFIYFPAFITLITTIAGGLYKWDDISKFAYRTNYLYKNAETIEHLIEDSHEVLNIRKNVDDLKEELRNEQRRADSLEIILNIMQTGKFPYDSIWLKSRSGHYYRTTIQDFLNSD